MTADLPQTNALRPDRWVMILFLGALAVRLVYLLQMVAGPYFVAPQLDELYHDLLARRFASGGGFGPEPFFRAPLYYLFLGAVYRLFGHDLFIPRLLQAVWGSFGVVLVYGIGRRAFSRPVAIVAGLLAMAWPTWIFFDGELLIPALMVPLNLAALYGLIRWSERPDRWRWLVAAGLAVGLSAIARPNILLATPLFAAWAGWVASRQAHLPAHAVAGRLALFTLAVLIPIAPVTARNRIVGGDWVLISSQAGINFYIGNHPHATGYTSATPRRFRFESEYEDSVALFARRQAELDEGHPLKASQVSRHWSGRAREEIAQAPAQWARLMVKKCVLFWSSVEIKNNKDIAYVAQFSWLLRALLWLLPFGVVAPMAWARILTRRPTAAQALLIGYMLCSMISVVLFFVCSRFRAPVVPVVLLFAAAFAVETVQSIRAKRWSRMIVPLGVLIAAGSLSWIDLYGVRKAMAADRPHEDWVAANGFLESGCPGEAIVFYRKALDASPDCVDAWLNLGRAQMVQNEPAAAAQSFEKALALEPENLSATNNLALLADQAGQTGQAHDLWLRVLSAEPDFVPALLGLGESLAERGQLDEARPLLERAQHLVPDNGACALALARLAFLQRDEQAYARWTAQAIRLGGPAAAQKINAWSADRDQN